VRIKLHPKAWLLVANTRVAAVFGNGLGVRFDDAFDLEKDDRELFHFASAANRSAWTVKIRFNAFFRRSCRSSADIPRILTGCVCSDAPWFRVGSEGRATMKLADRVNEWRSILCESARTRTGSTEARWQGLLRVCVQFKQGASPEGLEPLGAPRKFGLVA
jgi:hypothetical protein